MASRQLASEERRGAALTKCILPRVLRAANRVDSMIEDMPDASRLRAGLGVPVTSAPCNLVRVATDAQEDFAQGQGARLVLQAPKEADGSWDAVPCIAPLITY